MVLHVGRFSCYCGIAELLLAAMFRFVYYTCTCLQLLVCYQRQGLSSGPGGS